MPFSILKLIPVKTGLVSLGEAAKAVWLIIVLNTFWFKTIGFWLNSNSKSGNSVAALQFKVNEELEVVIYSLESITSSKLISSSGSFLTISYIYLPDTTISP